jgi:hypothetical protein
MKKLTLDLDDLKVESFETAGSQRGTVFGYDPVSCPTCGVISECGTCYPDFTCNEDCDSRPIIECLGSSGGHACQ